MLKVALTGGIGSGKSLVGQIFEELGATVVDSDQLSRDVIERGTTGFDEVVAHFGDTILSDGVIDREKLGELVFRDPNERQALEMIIHPRVREAFNEIASEIPESGVLINQIPLLVETDGAKNFDVVITVVAPLEVRKERLKARGLKDYEIAARISAQVGDDERKAISDYVIDNSDDQYSLTLKVENIYEKLKARASSN
jgi:dephospho-CoA kinase